MSNADLSNADVSGSTPTPGPAATPPTPVGSPAPAGSPAPPGPAAPWIGQGRGPSVRLEGVTVDYPGARVLSGIDLEIGPGALVALVGPSGSGKTSLLRCLAGFLQPSAGIVTIGGDVVSGPERHLPPERRQIGYVFQSHALWPHLSARDNVAYPWKVRGWPVRKRRQAAEALLARVGLGGLGERRPAELSGGERQRVALARALAGEPRILLMDEPFSSVDVMVRDGLMRLVGELVGELGLTTVFTTHDQAEATALAERTAVLIGGRLAQVGTPREVYERPVSSFVARFMGPTNLHEVTLVCSASGEVTARLAAGAVVLGVLGASAMPECDRAILVVRPEDLTVAPPAGNGGPRLRGTVTHAVERGSYGEVRVEALGAEWRVRVDAGALPSPGATVELSLRRWHLLAS